MFGLCPLLVNLLDGAGGVLGEGTDLRKVKVPVEKRVPQVEIFGPVGLRNFVRASLRGTHTTLNGFIRITELHGPTEGSLPDPTVDLYEREAPGENLLPNEGVLWTNIVQNKEFSVSAGPTIHSVPSSLGYVITLAPERAKIPKEYRDTIEQYKPYFEEQGVKNPLKLLALLQNDYIESGDSEAPSHGIPQSVYSREGIHLPNSRILPRLRRHPGKKLTVLGDTCDPSQIIPIAKYSDVLVHEATNAFLPKLDPSTKPSDTYEIVEERTRSRGHSTPEMAGRFAAAIKLGRKDGEEYEEGHGTLILNHFSSRYEDDELSEKSGKIMGAIRECAERGWSEKSPEGAIGKVVCARDGVEAMV